jgi:hypothetical protein
MMSLDWLVFAVGAVVTLLLAAGLSFTVAEFRRLGSKANTNVGVPRAGNEPIPFSR